MNFKRLRWVFLSMAVIVQVGCATANESATDSTPELQPVPSQEDSSHGWGANLHGM